MNLYYSGPREARRFTEFVQAPFTRAKGFPSSKVAGRKAAEAIGIRTPKLFRSFASPTEIELGALPDRIVLRANVMASRRGVYLLVRKDGRYFDSFTKRDYDEAGLRVDLAQRLEKNGRPHRTPILAEEFVEGENGPDQIPFDYKLFVFGGKVELIEQVDRNVDPAGLAFFDGQFRPLDPHCITFAQSTKQVEHRRPENWKDLIDAAERSSRHLDVPFVRLDVYTDGRDVIFGEFTKRPGGAFHGGPYRLSDAFDGELGGYYRMACYSMGIDIPVVTGLPPALRKVQRDQKRRASMKGRLIALIRRLGGGARETAR